MAILIVLAALPLLSPDIPPLVDLFGHMGRYRVELDLATSPSLQQYWDYRWAPIGNLGVDLLVAGLGRFVDMEAAVKLIVLAIPPMTVAGFLWVAREVHHRLPPTALFALPFAYAHPFMFGFVNYSLAIAFAFLAFGLWLRLARLGRLRLRALLFVPIGFVLFFTHIFGWGVLGLLCFSAEAVRQHDQGKRWLRSAAMAAGHAAVMALPLIVLLAWRSEAQGPMAGVWFNLPLKIEWVISALRDQWRWFDSAALILCLIVIVEARRRPQLTFSRNLAFSALVLLAAFLGLPWVIFGSAYADMRLFPYALAVALLAIRPRADMPVSTAWRWALSGFAFYLLRIVGHTVSFHLAAEEQRQILTALDHVPVGAKVVSLVGASCPRAWALPRNSHLGAMVIVRRQGFSNEQWTGGATNLLQLKARGVGPFSGDPSQFVVPNDCPNPHDQKIDGAIGRLSGTSFDYLWLIETPPFDPRRLPTGQLVWRRGSSALYRLSPAGRSTTQP